MSDRCFWCTDSNGNTAISFVVAYAERYVPPVMIQYCPFCGRKVRGDK